MGLHPGQGRHLAGVGPRLPPGAESRNQSGYAAASCRFPIRRPTITEPETHVAFRRGTFSDAGSTPAASTNPYGIRVPCVAQKPKSQPDRAHQPLRQRPQHQFGVFRQDLRPAMDRRPVAVEQAPAPHSLPRNIIDQILPPVVYVQLARPAPFNPPVHQAAHTTAVPENINEDTVQG